MTESSAPQIELSNLEDDSFHHRYTIERALGTGSSAGITLCRDARLERDVAVKLLHREVGGRSARARFLREARLQARLDHPGVVPVHDASDASCAQPWFTMKVVRGETLGDQLAKLDEAPLSLERGAGTRRPRLLAAFAQVCRTLAFAHDAGVVHRDLSPSNIMLGSYGEIHVLDWGLGKRIDRISDIARPQSAELSAPEPSLTRPGTPLGTPGYMAPEQAFGEVGVGPEADVYALGAILFEIITGRALHPGKSSRERLESAMRGSDPIERARDEGVEIAPELGEALRAATRVDPDQRLRSAAALAEAVEGFLDGDRDEAERRRLCAELVAGARLQLARGDDEGRASATRSLGRAIALDPNDRDAGALLSRLLLEPPTDAPPAVRERLDAWATTVWKTASTTETMRYLFWCSFIPLWFVMGITDATLAGLAIASLVMMTISSALSAAGILPGIRGGAPTFILSTVGIGLFTQVLSPIILAPTLMATNVLIYAANATPRVRYLAITCATLGMAIPIALEMFGVVGPTFEVIGDEIVVRSRAIVLEPRITYALLVAGATISVAVPAIAVGRLRDQLVQAQRALLLQSWHLEQLLPAGESKRS